MKTRLTILVDMDNVIADQRSGFYRVLEKEYPHIELPSVESLKEFDIELNFPAQHRDLMKSIRLREGFFLSLPLMPGAKEGLARLDEGGHHVRIVTAPIWEWKYCVPEKYAWVEEHLGREWCGKMILTRDKTIVQGDILIDDSPTAVGVREPMWEHVLFDQPYNRSVKEKRRVTWDTIETIIEHIAI